MKIIGHRGAAGIAPENSLEACRAALGLGVAAVEVDVRLTRDGRVICFHDERLDRLTSATGRVVGRDCSELLRLPLMPGAFGNSFPDARIPLLSTLLSAIPRAAVVYVEIKSDAHWQGATASVVFSQLADSNELRRARIISFSVDELWVIRNTRIDVWLGAAVELGVIIGRSELPRWKDAVEVVNPRAIHIDHRLLSPELLTEMQRTGALVNAWTVNDPDRAAELAAMGVDELTTDYPDRMKHLADQSRVNPET